MADRRRCRSGAGHHTPVEHARAASSDLGNHGDHGARTSEAREGQERESQGYRRRGELRRGRAISSERFGLLGRLTCAKKAHPSTWRQMRSSERWKDALGGNKVPGTRRRELGELRWWAAVRGTRSGGERAGERARERARVGGENGECASAVHSGGGGRGAGEPRMPSTRRRRPDTVRRARGAAVSERGEGEWTRRREAWAGFAGWAGWLAPALQ